MADLAAVTQIEITGKDSTGSTFAGVKDGLSGINSAVGTLQSALGGLIAGFSVGMFASAIKEAIDYADTLNDLSKQTGINVETLGGFAYAGKTAGVEIETIAKGTQKLANLMADAAGGNAKAAATFDAMGVAVKAADGSLVDMDETLFAVADQFASYADGPEKAALAQELFGKSGAALIPLLNEGGAKLREMVAEYKLYGGVSKETAAAADTFNDTLAKIKMIGGALMQELASALLPTLQAIAGVFVDLKVKGEGFSGIAGVLVTVVKGIGVAAVGVVASFEALGKGLGALAAAAVQLAQGNLKQAWETLKAGGTDAADAVSTAMDRASTIWDASTAKIAASTTSGMGKTKAPIAAVNAELKKQQEELDKLEAKWREVIAAQEGGWSPETLRKVEELNKLLAAGRLRQDEYNQALDDTLAKDPIIRKEQEEINRLWKETNDIVNKVTEAWAKDLKALDDQIQKQEAANATFGLGKAALIDLSIAQIENRIAVERSGDAYSPFADQLEEVRLRLIRLRDATAMGDALQQQKKDLDAAQKAWETMIGNVEQAFSSFIDDWLNNGFSNAAKNAWENFKKWALEALAQIAAKQIIVSITGAISTTGAGAGGLIPGVPGGGGGGSIFDSLLNAGSSLVSGFGDLAFAAADFAQLLGQGVGVIDAFSMAASGAGLTLGSIVPVVGAVVAAGTMIYNWVKSKEGGPKEGGFATTGPVPGIGGVDDSGRWFTPSGSDAQMLQAVQSLDATFNQILTALGGSGSAVFAQGFSTDPKGTAPSNVHTGVWVNGTQVFDNPNGNVGRSPEELASELQTQSMRAILAALQASELPQVVHDYLASIDVSTATIDQIQAALAKAAELKVLVDQVSALPEEMATGLLAALGASPELDAKIADFAQQFKAFSDAAAELHEALERNPVQEAADRLAAASETVYERVGRLRSGLEDSLAAYDGSTEGTKALTAATNAYIDAQVEALIQIEQIRDSLDAMFGETARTFELALMNTEQQKQFFIDEALATVKLLEATTDPAEIDRLSRIVNEDLTAAFRLMDPEEQKAQHDYLSGILGDAQEAANTQLDLAHDAVVEAGQNAQTILASINDAVTEVALKQQQAANDLIQAAADLKAAAAVNKETAEKQKDTAEQTAAVTQVQAQAASTMLEAANVPVNVNVTVDYGASGP